MRFDDKTAIVTGAAHGIGKATALRLAKEGAKVVLVDIDQAGIEQVAETIHAASGTTLALAVDIAISTQAGWWGQAEADREMQEIVDNVTGANVQVFAPGDHAALATWVTAHTGDGVSDLLILCGQLPDTIYEPGEAGRTRRRDRPSTGQ